QILGAGCAKCEKLAQNADAAAREAGFEYVLEKISGIDDILTFDVMQTPGLAVDGRVLCSGTLPGVDEIQAMYARAGLTVDKQRSAEKE
ncbi:MAG TPA: hypothetical protein DEB39_09160, partial [Planctomycetaceae bacterium]|nr:hypothetical protein [Planctomycetaceae bacterium]